MTAEHIASAVVALLVALFNLLVSGYALIAGGRQRTSAQASGGDVQVRLAFAAGPAGVGVWALAWFVSIFDPAGLEGARILGTLGAVVAMSGFALDALARLDPAWRRPVALIGLCAFAALSTSAFVALGGRSDVVSLGFMSRLLALVLTGIVVAAQVLELRVGRSEEARALARWMVVVSTVTGVLCAALAVAAFVGDRTFVDPMLLVVLLAELYALVYILKRVVEVRVLLSRALTYGLLSVVVAFAAASAFRLAGYGVDPVVVAITVAVALLASALFMGVSDRLATSVEQLLFPGQARLERALLASRGEVSALRRRLERAEKLAIAGELAASVAHEIKNPLSPIRGYAQLLEGKLAAVDPKERALFQKGLKIIREETDRIDQRVQGLLRTVRAERTKASLEETADLNRVVIEATAVAEGEAGRVRLVTRLEPSLGRVVGSEDELRGALLNLVKNAIEAMQGTGGATVEVTTRREEARAIVEIVDEGAGMPSEAERVFDAFFTTKQGGTGLGLAIARSAVDAAGGTLTLENRSDRRGAVARIELDLESRQSTVDGRQLDRRRSRDAGGSSGAPEL